MTPEQIHEAACRAGAVVMGSSDDLADLHYLMNAERLVRFLAAVAVPPCPVPLPPAQLPAQNA